ncbi:helix-turn-helix domain-containing protein [Agromyces sp. NPDC057679]|uniref:helix-turn-helix domain-containing protein n=1 Tax=Agromyces sp. NPDC057679 TaxID=3346207 RepID=UPI00366E1F2E
MPPLHDILTPAIKSLLADRQRSMAWLARTSGTPYARLYDKLRYRPGSISVSELLLICEALEIGILDLWEVEP